MQIVEDQSREPEGDPPFPLISGPKCSGIGPSDGDLDALGERLAGILRPSANHFIKVYLSISDDAWRRIFAHAEAASHRDFGALVTLDFGGALLDAYAAPDRTEFYRALSLHLIDRLRDTEYGKEPLFLEFGRTVEEDFCKIYRNYSPPSRYK